MAPVGCNSPTTLTAFCCCLQPADAADFLQQAKQEVEDKIRNPALRAKAQQVKAAPQKVDIKRSQRKQVVKAKEVLVQSSSPPCLHLMSAWLSVVY